MASSPPSLRSRIVRAGSWTLSAHVANQFLRLVSNLIMTRLLVPEMFGVMALASVILTGLQLFSDIGLNQGVIQSKRGHELAYLNTAWTVQILRGALIWAIALAVAAMLHQIGTLNWLPVGSAYGDPILPLVIAIIAVNALIGGFVSTRIATANRNLTVGRQTVLELISQVAGLIFMVVWAVIDRSIWALVAGTLFTTMLRVLFSHTLVTGERNQLHWDREAFADIYKFGKWVFLTSIFGFLAASGDRLILGCLVDSTTLGIYSIAFFIVGALKDIISKFNAKVAFPALSEVSRDRRHELRRVYYKFRLPLDLFALFSLGALFACGSMIVKVLYDERYSSAGWMIEVLAISLLASRFDLSGQCFMAIGKPKLLLPLTLTRLAVNFIGIPLGYFIWGIEGAVWAVVFGFISTIPLYVVLMARHEIFDTRKEAVVLPIILFGYVIGKGGLWAYSSYPSMLAVLKSMFW